MKKIWIATVCLLLAYQPSRGQNPASDGGGGLPLSMLNNFQDPPVIDIGDVNNQELIDSELPPDDTTVMGGYYFAKNYPQAKGGVDEIGVWDQSSDGRQVWRVTVTSRTAKAIGLIFKEMQLPEGAAFYCYDADKEQLNGPFTAMDNAQDGIFITPFLGGTTITVEYVHPLNGAALPLFRLRDVIHAYRELPLEDGSTFTHQISLGCHNNVVCGEFNDYCDQIRSVCVIMTPWTYSWGNCNGTNVETRWKGGSGALVNNSYNNFTPYILTARHVIWEQLERFWCVFNYYSVSGYTNVSETMFYFNYQSRQCDQNLDLATRHAQFVRGATVSASEPGWPGGPDMALLQLRIKPPIQYNTFYAGWNRQSKDDLPSWSVTGIHHPRLDIKKISRGNLHYSLAYSSFWGVDWYSGVTEKGSSGSPLFCDADKRIIGALSFGTNDNCDDHNEQDRFGRLRNFWNSARGFLSPDDHGRETYDGADPATYCQSRIELNGRVMPTALYHEGRPSMTIQASNYVSIANLAPTIMTTDMFRSKYSIKAGNAIDIKPGGSNFFETQWNTVLLLNIEPCHSTTGCQVEFNTQWKGAKKLPDNTSLQQPGTLASAVYPNPAKEMLNIAFGAACHLVIADVSGKVVFEKDLWEAQGIFSYKTSNLRSGIYFVTLSSHKDGSRETHKVVIQQ